MKHPQSGQMRLYSRERKRLYINASERRRFELVAQSQEVQVRTLALCLLYTGCRISEALAIRQQDIQFDEAIVLIKSLKKRDKVHLREVPVPTDFIEQLKILAVNRATDEKLWPINRTTAWRWIGSVMKEAGITGQQASPKGLRHSFGIKAVMQAIPLNIIQKWMGHADMKTTAIYAQAQGPEERQLAERMWQ